MKPRRSPAPKRITTKIAARWLTPRRRSAHKGDAGRVYILAGSRGMAGAAVLTALGASRSGAGLVRVGTVKSQQPLVARRAPLEVTSDSFAEDAQGRLSAGAWPQVKRAIEKFQADVIAVGPGLGRSRGVERLIHRLLYGQRRAVVLDADGLNALAAMSVKKKFSAPLVITPHPGEMSRLLNARGAAIAADRAGAARGAAKKFRAVALLKGAGTVVSDGRAAWVNTTGNPAMATGGMGDVLTGIVAATWAQNPGRPLEATALAVHLHGLAADVAVKKFPERTLLASDVAAALPRAFHILWSRKGRGGRG